MQHFFIILLFINLFSAGSQANELHLALWACNIERSEELLKEGEEDAPFAPNYFDRNTKLTPLLAAEHCPDETIKKQLIELILYYGKKYNVEVKSIVTTVYAENISNRRFPVREPETPKRKKIHKNIFIENESIVELVKPKDKAETRQVGDRSTAVLLGDTWVLQQKDNQSCGPACFLMRELDLGIKELSTGWYSYTGRTSKQNLIIRAKEQNIDFIDYDITTDSSDFFMNNKKLDNIATFIDQEINKYGPAVINGFNAEGGAHWFIVDSIDIDNDKCVTSAVIRDPFHGWQIKIDGASFEKILGKGIEPSFDSDSLELLFFTKKN